MKDTAGGELDLLEASGIKVLRFTGIVSPRLHPDVNPANIRAEVKKAITELKTVLGTYGLVILDEFNILCSQGLIEAHEVDDLLLSKPEGLELVLTGRGAPDDLINRSDLVTEMRNIKHPYERGIKARKGIEY